MRLAELGLWHSSAGSDRLGSMDEVSAELLRLAWQSVRSWRADNVSNLPAASRLVDAGAEPADVATAMNAAGYGAALSMMHMLDERGDPNGEPRRDWWVLVDPALGTPISALHEEFLMADPSGNEGSDLFMYDAPKCRRLGTPLPERPDCGLLAALGRGMHASRN